MQIFGEQNPIVTCPICGGTYRMGNINCLVAHPPGSCCHYGDEELSDGGKEPPLVNLSLP